MPQILKKTVLNLCAVALLFGVSGCATFKNAAKPPAAPAQINYQISSEAPAKMSDFPIGTYYAEKQRIAFTGYQKGQMTGMLFGVVGVLMVDQMNKSAGKGKFGNAIDALDPNILKETEVALEEQIKAQNSSRLSLTVKGDTKLDLLPYAVVVFDKDQLGYLYIAIKARLLGSKGDALWEGRYFASASAKRKFEGDNSWVQDDNLSTGIKQALERATWAIVQDFDGKLTGTKKITVKGFWTWKNETSFGSDIELRALQIGEREDLVVLRFVVGDVLTFSGTHVLEKKNITIKDGSFDLPSGL